jgi:hypothetical protein
VRYRQRREALFGGRPAVPDVMQHSVDFLDMSCDSAATSLDSIDSKPLSLDTTLLNEGSCAK